MTRVLRYLVRKFYTLCAIVLITLAVLVQCGRSFSHLLSDYPQEISDYLSEQLNADVHIGRINAQWDGLKPVVEAQDIRITSQTQEPIFALQKARMRLDLLGSLINFRLVWGSINLHQAELDFEQTAEGFWHLPGLHFKTTPDNQNAAQLDVLFDMLLLSNHIEFHQTHLDFHFVDGHHISLDSPSVRLENKGNFHRLSLNVDVEEHEDAITLVMEGRGDPRNQKRFRAQGYLQLNEFPTSEPLAAAGAILLPGIADWQWRSDGSLNARLWFSTREKGEGFNLTGQLGLQTLSLPLLGQRLELASFNTDVKGYWLREQGWQLALQNIQADVNETRIESLNIAASASRPGAPILLQSDEIDLQRWTQILDDAGAFGRENLQAIMLTLNPRGQLRNIQVQVPLDNPRAWRLQANANQVGVDAWRGVPALTKVDGFVQAGQQGGFINIDSRKGFGMHYVPTYAEAMTYDSVRGQVAWWLQPDNNQIYVNSGELQFRSGNEETIGHMWLAIPWQRNSGDIDLYLQIGARNLDAGLYKKYTPALMPPSLLNWLQQSIGDHNNGKVNEAGFVYRGTLNTKNAMARSHQLYLDIHNAELNYHPGWPAIRDLRGRVLVSDSHVDASVFEGKIYSSHLQQVHVQSRPNPQDQGALLTVNGKVSGIASDGLRVLRESMLRQFIGDSMDRWNLTGDIVAQIDLAVPLDAKAKGARQRVDVDIEASSFELQNFDVQLQDVKGRITYDNQSGVSSDKLRATLFDEPVSVALDSQVDGTEQKTVIDVVGNVKHQRLAEWSDRPELLFLDGKIPYRTRIELLHGQRNTDTNKSNADNPEDALPDSDKRLANILVSSDLNGVAVDLPVPYGKSPEESRELNVNLHINQQSMVVDVDYAGAINNHSTTSANNDSEQSRSEEPIASASRHAVQALFKLRRDGNRLLSANVALGNRATLTSDAQFLLNGYLPEFTLEQWQSVQERYLRYSQQIIPQPVPTSDNALIIDPNLTLKSDDLSETSTTIIPARKTDPTQIAGLPFRADIVLGRYQLGPLTLQDVALRIRPQMDAWDVDFSNPIVAGHLRLPEEKTQPMSIDLQYLHLSRSMLDEKAVDIETLEAEFDPRSLPLANISVAELHVDDRNYGNWSVQLRPDDKGAVIDNISGNIRGVTIKGLHDAEANHQPTGAQLFWHIGATGTHTRFVGTLTAGDMADVMHQWDKPDIIESTSASYDVDLTWPGAPQDFALASLKGTVNLLLQDGRFKRNPSVGSDGFLRLVALVNFDTLARRLRLDFSDLYKSGLAYDELKGSVTFDSGKLILTEPLQMSSPSSRLQMAGSINLEDETIDSRLVATLPVAGNLTFLAALATGLPAAAGVYVVSKIFKKQVDQATSISYRIRGSWDEPEMKFDRLFESETSLRNSVTDDEIPSSTKESVPSPGEQ